MINYFFPLDWYMFHIRVNYDKLVKHFGTMETEQCLIMGCSFIKS